MVENFIGTTLEVELTNGSSLEGIVSHIDSHTQLLTLKDVTFHSNDGNVEKKAFHGVPGTDIKDLKIIKPSTNFQQQQKQQMLQKEQNHNSNNDSITETINNNNNNNNNINNSSSSSSSKATSLSSSSSVYSSTTTIPTSQPSVLLSKSPFSDPAIISYSSQVPSILSQRKSIPTINPYDLSRTTSPLFPQENNFYTESQTLKKSSTNTQTTSSVADSDSKGDEEEIIEDYRLNLSSRNNKPNGFHRGDSNTLLESDNGMYNYKRTPRRRKNGNNNYNFNYSENYSTRKSRKGRNQTHEWAGGDVNEFKSEEFDFQSNLDLFDKEKVFAEIRESDYTAPENLLVNINRNSNYRTNNNHNGSNNHHYRNNSNNYNNNNGYHRNGLNYNKHHHYSSNNYNNHDYNPLPKLSSNENVLETSSRKPKFYHTEEEEDDESANDAEDDSDESWKNIKKINGNSISNGINGSGEHKKVKIRTLTGVVCPTVQSIQMVEVERLTATETGPNEDQMIENAGRGASMMCLQALGGSRRIRPNNHNEAPLVVILAGNNKTGAYGLATARQLANHGCHVIALVVGEEKDLHKNVAYQKKILLPTGGKVVNIVEELPQQLTNPVDLIVDALLGYQFSLRDIPDDHDKRLICDLMEWANINKAPVLSLDMPSGVNGNTGHPVNPAHYIRPKWTLCLGAPKNGCRNRSITGELFLADIGIPRVCWKKIGVKGWGMPWGSEYLIGLEYDP